MDAFKALAGQQGCAADGTAAQRNPLSQFVHQTMGGPQKQGPPLGAGGQMYGPGGQQAMSEVDQGFAQGMGVMQGPRGPVMAGPGAVPGFVAEFEQMQRAQGAGPMMHGPRGPMARGPMPDQWVNDFERMQLGGPPQANIHMEAAYRNSFRQHQGPRPMGQRWAGQMAARPPPSQMDRAWQNTAQPPPAAQQWAQEMAGPKEAPDAAKWAEEAAKQDEATPAADMEATRRATDDLVKVMASNPKFRESEFFDFMSKVNSGELSFENNTVVETGVKGSLKNAPLDAAWQQSSDGAQAAWEEASGSLDSAWNDEAMNKMEQAFSKAWQDANAGKEVDLENLFKNAIEENGLADPQFNEAWAGAQESGMDRAWSETQTANVADLPYELTQENPFSTADDPFELGMEFFRQGKLKDAILAFEAAVSKDASHSEAWRMLGVSHQENDEDPKAIRCIEHCIEQDPHNLQGLLGLGVSYVNELDQERALKNLKAWVMNNPQFIGLEVAEDMYGDGSLMDNVMQLMLKAQEWAPNDADVQEVLGVLFNVSRDYNSAVIAFQRALKARPDDYGLLNKIGATLANSGRSEEAIAMYHQALQAKPRYARGWLNLGISHSNLGNYKDAARCYLKALDLNPEAHHIWAYLRICMTCMERFDQIALADKRDIASLKQLYDM